jgi:hypothetical protein
VLDPEQPQSPSPEPASEPAGEALPSAAPEVEEPAESQSWWSRLWHTRGHHEIDSEAASPTNGHNGHAPIAPAPRSVTLTEEELQERVNRQAQSLRDRDIARANREAAEAERKRLRDEDPFTYAQQDRQREELEQTRQRQTAQLMDLLGHVGRQHDAVTLDPVFYSLPEAEQQRIRGLPNAGEGFPGRKVVVEESLKSLRRLEYERGYRDAQAKLKKDPVFRKSVLAEQRGGYEEPELYSGDGSPREGLPDENPSTILRKQYFGR